MYVRNQVWDMHYCPGGATCFLFFHMAAGEIWWHCITGTSYPSIFPYITAYGLLVRPICSMNGRQNLEWSLVGIFWPPYWLCHSCESIHWWLGHCYDRNRFPGEVTTFGLKDELKVNVMPNAQVRHEMEMAQASRPYFLLQARYCIKPPTCIVAEHRGRSLFHQWSN